MYDKAKLRSRLLQLLEMSPGLTTRDCVRQLRVRGIDVDKKLVNGILYGSADVVSLGAAPPHWFLVEQLGSIANGTDRDVDPSTASADEILSLLRAI